MKKSIKKPYHLGININNNSIGWATIDDQFQILSTYDANPQRTKKQHKLAFGSHKFEPGKTAEDTRLKRSGRRNNSRRRQRIKWLNDIFAPYIDHVDPDFLRRLKWSNLAGHDKKFEGTLLFPNSADERAFYDKYPTIYHLRLALMTEQHKFDIRLVYLAIHHIVSHRGHFFNKTPMSAFKSQRTDYLKLFGALNDLYADTQLGSQVKFDLDGVDQFVRIMLDKTLSKKDKKTQLFDAIHQPASSKAAEKVNQTVLKELIKAVCENDFKLRVLFQLSDGVDSKLNFADEDYELKLSDIIDSLSGTQLKILENLQELYNGLALEQIVPDGKSFSEVQVANYDLWRKQYDTLRAFRKQVMNSKLTQKLRSAMDSYGNRTPKNGKKINHEQFQSQVKSVINEWSKKESLSNEAQAILQWIDNNQFMLKLRNKNNQLIPHQLHQLELDQIIENQSKYYPFLKTPNPNKDRVSMAKYQLDELVAFTIPYYVGPLVDNKYVNDTSKSRFAWMARKQYQDPKTGQNVTSNEPITPWNFYDQVDLQKSANNFIRRSTNKDSYLLSEDVLPKNSIVYQRYNVLNELNKIRVNEKLLRPGDKQKIFNDLFRNYKNVSAKRLKDYLIKEYGYTSDIDIQGLSDPKKFTSSYSTYQDFKRILGDRVDNANLQNDLEKIVEWSTIFPQGPMFRQILNKLDWLTNEERAKLSQLRYAGWGRLSLRTLTGILNKNGERVIDVMWNTNLNFNQVIVQPSFQEQFVAVNEAYLHDASNDLDYILENSYLSPQNKKALRRTMAVVDDIVERFQQAPQTISIQFLRQADADGQVSKQRKGRINTLYKEITKEAAGNWFEDKTSLMDELKTTTNFDDKHYLFFLQFGRDLFTGQKINLSNLGDYEVRHILPPSFVHDDSLNNLVLVKRGYSQPMNVIRTQQRPLWNQLRSMHLLSGAKLSNLFAEPSQMGRHARESYARHSLTSTSQIIKLAAQLLTERYRKYHTKVITVRNEMVTQLEQKYGIYYRTHVNEFKNGQTAYVTGVAGLFLYKTYPKLQSFFVYGLIPPRNLNLKELRSFNFLYHLLRKQDSFVIPETGGLTADQVNETVQKNLRRSYLMYLTEKPGSRHDQVFKETIFPHGGNRKLFPLKKGKDTALYGGYTSLNFAYLTLLRISDKNGHFYRLVPVPRYISDRVDYFVKHDRKRANELILDVSAQYLPKALQKKEVKVELPKVFYHERVVQNGQLAAIQSSKKLQSVDQLVLSSEAIRSIETSKEQANLDTIDKQLMDVYDEIIMQVRDHMPVYADKGINEKLLQVRDRFSALNAYPEQDSTTEKRKILPSKMTILNNLIYALQSGPSVADLRVIGLTSGFPAITNNMQFEPGDSFILESPSGLFKSQYTLK